MQKSRLRITWNMQPRKILKLQKRSSVAALQKQPSGMADEARYPSLPATQSYFQFQGKSKISTLTLVFCWFVCDTNLPSGCTVALFFLLF